MRVVTFGELMLRLQPYNYERFVQCDHVEFTFGGGEANVAVSLANYGHNAEFVTAVPDNEIGECATAALNKYGVSKKNVAKCGERLGIYYLESGCSMRPSKVVYDRAHSSIATATAADFDFDKHTEYVGMQPGDVPVTFADTSALERDFGFRPQTPLREGLRKFAQWYKEFYG